MWFLPRSGMPPVNDADLGQTLLAVARTAIGERLGLLDFDETRCASLQQLSATFVTLRRARGLRGCIGSIEPIRPLGVDVRENAVAAAFCDPRFAPLESEEFEDTAIEVSLLSPAERIDVETEEDLVARLRPGMDGLAIHCDRRRALLLPQVWCMLSDPWEFVATVKEKAGLPRSFWSPAIRFSRFSVVKWAERDFALSET